MAQQRVDGAVLEAANAKAKAQFLAAYEGATISIPTEFHHRPVIRAYKRTFAVIMRNWWLATNTARAQHSDRTLPAKLEAAMLRKVDEVKKHFQQAIKQCEALVASADVDTNVISHAAPFRDDVRFLGPVAMRFREVLLLSDKYLDLTNLLYTFGEIDQKANDEAAYDVRNKLAAIDTSVRNHWIGTRKRINEEGKARPNYKGAAEGEAGGAQPAADPTQVADGAAEKAAAPEAVAGSEQGGGSSAIWWVVGAIVLLGAVAAGVLRYLGKI